MKPIQTGNTGFLYQSVIDLIRGRLESGTLRPGDKLPSLRRLSVELNVSVPTVRQAYVELERQGRVEARPKSGYFVRPEITNRLVRRSGRVPQPVAVRCQTLVDEVTGGIHKPNILALGIANPSMALPATKTLHRAMKRVMSRAEDRVLAYAPTIGDAGLRRQIAYRYLNLGGRIDPDQIIITNGAQEALSLALQTLASPGDIIAVESPTYHGQLELIESLGMMALEIETCPTEGMQLDCLESSLSSHRVAACMFATSINNPLGSRMPAANRERLVELLERHDVPMIEDDVYGDLVFDGSRPHPAQFSSKKGLVVTCSSFSKTVAPGYRIGWMVSRRFHDDLAQRKRAFSCSSGLLQQLTLAEFLGSGDYDRYLNRLKPVLRENAQRMAAAVSRSFPSSTRLSKPQGGSVLWVETPGVDSVALFRRALAQGVSIMPGVMFAANNRYKRFIRISFGHPWSDDVEAGIDALGALVRG